jgi:hypothetical protein
MDIKDWLSLVAIAISLWSLHTARGSAVWQKTAKGAELRAEILTLAVGVSFKMDRCREMCSGILKYADSSRDLDTYKLAQQLEGQVARVATIVDAAFKEVQQVPPIDGLKMYQDMRHKWEGMRQSADTTYDELLSLHDRLPIRSGPSPKAI